MYVVKREPGVNVQQRKIDFVHLVKVYFHFFKLKKQIKKFILIFLSLLCNQHKHSKSII